MTIHSSVFNHENSSNRILHEDHDASHRISKELLGLLPTEKNQPIVFVCIGTDRSTGDSLGPLVGTLLKEKKISTSSFSVYGTLAEPIHAMNLEERLADIHKLHIDPFIVGIDACLGKVRSVGIVQIAKGPVKPGAGVNKDLPPVGNAHITGIVNVSGFMEFMVLQNTRLNLVLNMAKTIADGIHRTHLQLNLRHHYQPLNWSLNQEKTL
jgi:putative sporulation protein YyaC